MIANRNTFKQNKGVVLFMTLVLLLIMTTLGLSSVQVTSLQEHMARNFRDTNFAFLSAEAGVTEAEAYIESFDSIDKLYTSGVGALAPQFKETEEIDGMDPSPWMNVDWDTDSTNYFTARKVNGLNFAPKYMIEHIKTIVTDGQSLNLNNIGQRVGAAPREVFRITVYGTGGKASTHVMIQSTYGRRF